jgi:sec-independent protein translocase protein TatA
VGNLGFGELVVILLVVVLLFGAKRLPALGESVGKAISGLKRGLASNEEIDVTAEAKRVTGESSAEKLPAKGTEKAVDAEVVEKKS